ncbi:unnamed protein product [Chondrus crispus]|uniref:Uncharacterized protein n=1 Tax=Chondrus crispus TaxID=2769 RepID=R7Q7Q6_CHOCR|nr:unnamed protein product [Chondrus crispus]CDF34054.1 unnamed protein product [Chondrus crispus]|eukprot:XP_005713873.1 unnamed protein product [Chondrus crispus]
MTGVFTDEVRQVPLATLHTHQEALFVRLTYQNTIDCSSPGHQRASRRKHHRDFTAANPSSSQTPPSEQSRVPVHS